VGSLLPVKNVPTLLRAFASLGSRIPRQPLELVIVGDGAQQASLADQAVQLGVAGSVRFVGARSHGEIALWLGASDLLCLPSLAEGVPNVVLEALASGRPVVASNVGGIPEVHPGNVAGALVPPTDEKALADALQRTLLSPVEPERIAALVSGHTWGANAERVLGRLARLGLADAGPAEETP
jgi:glycosyltransferase involved in cell wall biosynthesis